jgi:uncharacterized glyoxalase superfamily protein PhnB
MPQRIIPYLLYEDVAGAIDWLSAAFGFRERLRYADENGVVNHAEIVLTGDSIMLGHPGADFRNPRRLGGMTHLTHVYVEDVDAHCERAREAGATILSEPADQAYGDRRYDAEDLEGQRWSFAQRLKDVAPADWGATAP